jgi:hypothetical protein
MSRTKRAKHSDAAMLTPSLHQDFSFGFDKLSDITVHYRSASYHLHQFALVRHSKYFEALIMDDSSGSSCNHDPLCHSTNGNHRCITLEGDQIGGVDVTAEQLNELYAESDDEWREKIMSSRQNDKWPSHFYMVKVISTDTSTDKATVDSYEIDYVRRHVMIGQTYAGDRKASALIAGACSRSNHITEHANYHLADYFQSTQLLTRYETQALVTAEALASNLAKLGDRLQLWRLLLLADRFN